MLLPGGRSFAQAISRSGEYALKRPRRQRSSGLRSSAATRCIFDVPGFAKHTQTSFSERVSHRLSAPFRAVPPTFKSLAEERYDHN
jgi:hypothetical protein